MKTKKLSEISDIQYGYAFDSHYFTNDNKYPQLVRIRDIKRGFSETYYLGQYDEDYVVHYGDLLIGMDGNFNISRWKSEDALLNQRVCKIAAKQDIIDEEYLQYALSRRLKHIEEKTAFVTVKHLSAKTLSNLKLEVPSQVEQIKIAQIISKISKAINTKKDELRKLDELIKARFVEMFGDPISNNKSLSLKEFREICDLKAGDFTPAKQIFKVQDPINQYPCYGGNGIRGFVSNYTHDGKYVLIGRQGALCGNVKLASGKFKNTEHAILVNPKIPINVFWLFELFDLEKLNRFKSGAAQPGLAVKTLNKILIPNVDLECQNEFANFVQQVDKSKFENIVYLNKMLLMKILSQLGDVSRD